MTHTPSTEARDAQGHVWSEGVNIGAGPDQLCAACGVRKSDLRSKLMCLELQRVNAPRKLPAMDYDPFASGI